MKASKKGKDSSDVDDIFTLFSDNDDTNKTSNGDSEYNPSNSMPDVEESASSIIEKSTHSTDKDGNEINEEDIEGEIDDGVDIVQDSISEVITEEKNAMTNALNDSSRSMRAWKKFISSALNSESKYFSTKVMSLSVGLMIYNVWVLFNFLVH